nr:glycoside hydrolase domain-containing protein [Nakamurella aerolata]
MCSRTPPGSAAPIRSFRSRRSTCTRVRPRRSISRRHWAPGLTGRLTRRSCTGADGGIGTGTGTDRCWRRPLRWQHPDNDVSTISLTHLNGVGCPGQGAVGLMPASTPQPVASGARPTGVTFKTATETAKPGLYSVQLDNKVTVELTATTRTGMAQFSYPNAGAGYLALDTKLNGNSNSGAGNKISAANTQLTIGDDGRTLSGTAVAPAFCTPYGTKFNSPVYFYAELNRSLKAQSGGTVNTVQDGAAVLQYQLPADDPTLTMRVGISAVSQQNAKLNLQTENAASTFDQVRQATDAAWNTRLNSIQVDRAADPAALTTRQREQLTKFYTALYRVFGSPTVYSDVNGDFRSMAAAKPYPADVDVTGTVLDRPTANVADYPFRRPDGSTGGYRTHYSGLSMWDTYRSQAQLLALLAPDVASEVNQSLVVDGLQCGAFPHWVDASDDSTPMAGDNAPPMLAGAYAFGANNFDLNAAARLTLQSGYDAASSCNGNASFPGFDDYLADGYYPDASSANIERYNSDWAAAQLLAGLPESVKNSAGITAADTAQLQGRAQWWTSIFDPATTTIAARSKPAAPGQPGPLVPGSFHESTEPNYFFSFGQSWPQLITAIGGPAAAVERLNRLFSIDNALTVTPTAKQLNGGQESQGFYMGNEMGFPAPWAYNAAGKPAATQYIVAKLMDIAFTTGRAGLPGNDDMGATSSWYVFAALGMFPTVASEGALQLSTPQFPGITVHRAAGEPPLRIETSADAAGAPFIQSMTVDGAQHTGTEMTVAQLASAQTLRYTLGSNASSWGAATPAAPVQSAISLRLPTDVPVYGTDKPVAATATVTLPGGGRPHGTVVLRSGRSTLSQSEVGADGTATLPIPATTPAGVMAVTATFVPADPRTALPATTTSQKLQVAMVLSTTTVTADVVKVKGKRNLVVTTTVKLSTPVAVAGTANVNVAGKKVASVPLNTGADGTGRAVTDPIPVTRGRVNVVVTWLPDDPSVQRSTGHATVLVK